MGSLKEHIRITMDEDILKRLRALAAQDQRSLSQYITLILKNHLKRKQGK